MHDPEPPEIRDHKPLTGIREKSHGIKRRYCQCCIEQKPWHVAEVMSSKSRFEASAQYGYPEKQSQYKEDLPKPSEIEILPALMSNPEPRLRSVQPSFHAGILSGHAAKDHEADSRD